MKTYYKLELIQNTPILGTYRSYISPLYEDIETARKAKTDAENLYTEKLGSKNIKFCIIIKEYRRKDDNKGE